MMSARKWEAASAVLLIDHFSVDLLVGKCKQQVPAVRLLLWRRGFSLRARLWSMGRPVRTGTGELHSFPELKGSLVFDEKRPDRKLLSSY